MSSILRLITRAGGALAAIAVGAVADRIVSWFSSFGSLPPTEQAALETAARSQLLALYAYQRWGIPGVMSFRDGRLISDADAYLYLILGRVTSLPPTPEDRIMDLENAALDSGILSILTGGGAKALDQATSDVILTQQVFTYLLNSSR